MIRRSQSLSIARRFHAEARENAVAKLEDSTAKSLYVRVFRDGRKATLTTSDFSPEGMREAAARAVAQTAYVATDEYAGLPDELFDGTVQLGLHDPQVPARDLGDPRPVDRRDHPEARTATDPLAADEVGGRDLDPGDPGDRLSRDPAHRSSFTVSRSSTV